MNQQKTLIAKEEALREMLYQMNIPSDYPDYSSPDYWNKRYSNEKGQTYEWLQDYESMRPFILQKFNNLYDAEILHVGCGNSRFSEFLYKDGFKNITNIDFSSTVIQEMTTKYSSFEEMEYTVMDVTNIQYDENCFDFVFDKGTYDCLLSSAFDPEEKADIMLENVYHVLKNKGDFILISIGHPEDRLPHLRHPRLSWNVQIFELDKPTVSCFKGFDDEECHYMYVCTKIK